MGMKAFTFTEKSTVAKNLSDFDHITWPLIVDSTGDLTLCLELLIWQLLDMFASCKGDFKGSKVSLTDIALFLSSVEKCMCCMQAGTQMIKLRGSSKGLVRFYYLDEHKSCIRWRPSRKNEKAKSECQPQNLSSDSL